MEVPGVEWDIVITTDEIIEAEEQPRLVVELSVRSAHDLTIYNHPVIFAKVFQDRNGKKGVVMFTGGRRIIVPFDELLEQLQHAAEELG